jgi:hypothetical protein
MLAWPKSSWTYLGWIPWTSESVVQGWRRSWTRIRGSPALSNSCLKGLVPRFDGHGGPGSGGEYEPVILPQPYVLHTLFELPPMGALKRYLSMVSSNG